MPDITYVTQEEMRERYIFIKGIREMNAILSKPFNGDAFRLYILHNKEFYACTPEASVCEALFRTDEELEQRYKALKNC